ncbi:hypothetical protein DPMN_060496 [Dreissena polymorpha]|uniref:Uncharacterized protein n=1 Tax=Dreissena polymorpha TaxID=45954 RepID=A0A9D4C5B9_DREPO|nr:hypothetical protein DPMN_060496 [Dreissena polymorpha]
MDHLPTTSPLPDIALIFESGFIKCSVQMFASEFMSLHFLFPPSQQTLDDILFEADTGVNVTARHERIKGIFCRCLFVLLRLSKNYFEKPRRTLLLDASGDRSILTFQSSRWCTIIINASRS